MKTWKSFRKKQYKTNYKKITIFCCTANRFSKSKRQNSRAQDPAWFETAVSFTSGRNKRMGNWEHFSNRTHPGFLFIKDARRKKKKAQTWQWYEQGKRTSQGGGALRYDGTILKVIWPLASLCVRRKKKGTSVAITADHQRKKTKIKLLV